MPPRARDSAERGLCWCADCGHHEADDRPLDGQLVAAAAAWQHHVLVITVASFPPDLGQRDQDEHPFYLEVFGEAEPLLDTAHAQVIRPAGRWRPARVQRRSMSTGGRSGIEVFRASSGFTVSPFHWLGPARDGGPSLCWGRDGREFAPASVAVGRVGRKLTGKSWRAVCGGLAVLAGRRG
jgi:hypothetical protein